MSAQVLSIAAPVPGLLTLGSGMVGLIRANIEFVEPSLEEGIDELTVTEEEIQRLADADVAFLDAQTTERAARQAKDEARDGARGWIADLRARSRGLALYSKGAHVLQRVLVDPFAYASHAPEAELPRQVEAMARVAAGYLKLLGRSRYTAEDLARGPALAAALREADAVLIEKVTLRRAASAARSDATAAVVKRLQSLDGRMDLNLPEKEKVKLASLRQECLPLKSAPAEQAPAAEPADEESE